MVEVRTRWLIVSSALILVSTSEPCAEMCSCASETVNCSNTALLKITFNLDAETQVLDLSHNLIEVLHNGFFSETRVSNLNAIYLNDNNVRSIEPEVFKSFEALRQLYLQNNKIDSLHPATFQSNTNLITLDLSGNIMTALKPTIFELNFMLSWVNVRKNSLDISTISPTIFHSSLNTVDIEMCKTPKYSINSFQNIPILKQSNLTGNKTFSLQKFISYQNGNLKENFTGNFVLHKLKSLGFGEFDEFRYDEILQAISSSSSYSPLICFCHGLSVWFWCYERAFSCTVHTSDLYSLLNCNTTSRGTSNVAPYTSTPSSSSSLLMISSAIASTAAESYISSRKNRSNRVINPFYGPINALFYVIYTILGIALLVIAIGIAVVFVYRKRRRENTIERKAEHTDVPLTAPQTHYYACAVVTEPRNFDETKPITDM
jgi:Leucine-rich repeat (LRR) protein